MARRKTRIALIAVARCSSIARINKKVYGQPYITGACVVLYSARARSDGLSRRFIWLYKWRMQIGTVSSGMAIRKRSPMIHGCTVSRFLAIARVPPRSVGSNSDKTNPRNELPCWRSRVRAAIVRPRYPARGRGYGPRVRAAVPFYFLPIKPIVTFRFAADKRFTLHLPRNQRLTSPRHVRNVLKNHPLLSRGEKNREKRF